jgi:hypothetical protein
MTHNKLTVDEFFRYAVNGDVEGITAEVAQWLSLKLGRDECVTYPQPRFNLVEAGDDNSV